LGYFGVELSWDGGDSHTAARYSWGQLIAGSNLRQAGGLDRLWGRSWTSEDFLDANFAVRASFGGIANSMAIDYLAVQVHYTEQTTPRTLLSVGESTRLEFAADGSRKLAPIDWPDARVYVNGKLDAPLTEDWNRVVVTTSAPNAGSGLLLGSAESAFLTFPFHGHMDELLLFEAELSPDEIEVLDQASAGAPGQLEP
jgi:hypothetical protein